MSMQNKTKTALSYTGLTTFLALAVLVADVSQAQDLRIISGVIHSIPKQARSGHACVTIVFEELRQGGETSIRRQCDVTAKVGNLVGIGGLGNFQGKPANYITFREWVTEDSRRGSGSRELDTWEINSSAYADRVHIGWRLSDNSAEVREINFMMIGVPAK